ncbi:MAG TPA: hypothetical protein VEN79_15090, partial [Terriglobia bacterium]|nr:hypothetical protein [Terriglobia bacterium]
WSRQESKRGTDNVRGHHLATIEHHGDSTNERFVLDLEAHEYVQYEVDRRGLSVGAKSIPASYKGTIDIWIESTDTGERQVMFGQVARHIITKERRVPGPDSCADSSESETDGWYIDYSAFPQWRRPSYRAFGLAFGARCLAKPQVHRSGVELGFPLKVTTTLHQQMPPPDAKVISYSNTLEVVEFSNAALDPALFVVPSDFRKVSELTNMDRPPNPTVWEGIKEWFRDLFR